MTRETPLIRAALLGGALTLAACSGGGDSVAAGSGTGTGITGVAAKGLMSGTTVEVFAATPSGFIAPGTQPLAQTVTDQLGRFDLVNRPDAGDLLLRTRGGSYLDESDPAPLADKRRIVLAPDQGFEVLLPAGQNTVAITPFSQMILNRARVELDNAIALGEPGTLRQFFDVVRARVAGSLGFDPVSDLPANPINPAGASPAGRAYAMSLGGFAQQVNSSAIRLRMQPSFAVLQAVVADMDDGVFDGQNFGNPVLIFTGSGSVQLPVFDFNQQIERFRNNNFGAYGGAATIVFDEDVLSGPITIDNTPPLVDNFAASVEQGGTLSVAPPGLLDGTSDIDGDTLTVETTPVSGPQSGQLTLNSDGSFEYVHNGSPGTTDSFTFAVIDGNGGRTTATATITIIPQAANRVYNTAYLELDLKASESGNSGEFSVFQDRGVFDLELGSNPRPLLTTGPFTEIGEGSVLAQTFQGQEGPEQVYSLFASTGGEIEPAETVSVNRAADGVLFTDPMIGLFNDFGIFDREDESAQLVPVGDDLLFTSIIDSDSVFAAINSNEAPTGAYLDGSPLGRLQRELDLSFEIGLAQSTDFDVANLAGDYGFSALYFFQNSDGQQTISATRGEFSRDPLGVSVGEVFDFNAMNYAPNGLSGSTVANQDTGTAPNFRSTYTPNPDGTLMIEYSENGTPLPRNVSGLASPDGELLIVQEHNVDTENEQPQFVEDIFLFGVRRAGGTVDLEGRNFRLNMLALERSADDQQNAIAQFVNVPIAFQTGGVCTIDRVLGGNVFVATRLSDAGPLLVDNNDDGETLGGDCSYTTLAQGLVVINISGTAQDPNGESYQGYISASGDVMVLQYARNETGFLQRGLAIAFSDTGLSTPDNQQPDVSVSPPSAAVGAGGTLQLTASVDDPDDGPQPLSIEWLSTIGAFTAPASATTQWIAPQSTAGTTLLTAIVDDGQRSRLFDVPVTFGQQQALPKPASLPALGITDAARFTLLVPDAFDFLFTLFNPFDTREQNYSCQGDGQQIPDGTVDQVFNDNDSSGSISAGDTLSLTFNDCAQLDLIRSGGIDFSINDVQSTTSGTVISYNVSMNYNERDPNEPRFESFVGDYFVTYLDASQQAEPSETYTISSNDPFVVRDNNTGSTASPIANGVEFTLAGGYNAQISRLFNQSEYVATMDYDISVQRIVNDSPFGALNAASVSTSVPLQGVWNANLPGAGTEAGVPQGIDDPFAGQFTLVVTSVGQSGPIAQTYRFTAGGSSELPRVVVAIDEDQDGTFDSELPATWDDVLENRGLGGSLLGPVDLRTVLTDGSVVDWDGRTPDAPFVRGDVIGPASDITGVFVAFDNNDIVFRMDVDGAIDLQNNQYGFLYVPYNEAETDCINVTLDLDDFDDPGNSPFCHLFVASGFPQGAHNGCGTGLAQIPTRAGANGSTLEIAAQFSLQQPSNATHLKVFHGDVVDLPGFNNLVQSQTPFCVALPQ